MDIGTGMTGQMEMKTAVVNEAMVAQMRYAVTALVADLNESLRKQVIFLSFCHVLRRMFI
jgi:hypothetical protein